MKWSIPAAALVFSLGLALPAHADDGPKISFTFNLGVVTVSITGIERDTLHDEQTKAMLERAAQLAHYSVKQLRWQKDFPDCLKSDGEGLAATCLEREK